VSLSVWLFGLASIIAVQFVAMFAFYRLLIRRGVIVATATSGAIAAAEMVTTNAAVLPSSEPMANYERLLLETIENDRARAGELNQKLKHTIAAMSESQRRSADIYRQWINARTKNIALSLDPRIGFLTSSLDASEPNSLSAGYFDLSRSAKIQSSSFRAGNIINSKIRPAVGVEERLELCV
jgi:hypothetical protein